MKYSKNTFQVLAIWMMGFGVAIGLVFPFFAKLFGVPNNIAFSLIFFSACIFAGLVVGAVNIILTKITVENRLKLIASKMTMAKQHILSVADGGDLKNCTPENCYVNIESNDAFGESALAFNELIESFSKTLQTQDAIHTYTELLTSQLELVKLGQEALVQLISYTMASAGAILVEGEGELQLLSSIGLREPQKLTTNQIVLNTLQSGNQFVNALPDQVIVESMLTEFRPREVVSEPILYKDVPLGTIILATATSFSPEILKQIKIFSHSLALALHNALEHEQLQRLAAIDALTGLLNRRFGLVRLREEYTRSVRTGNSLGVLMIDIDHFKKVNDSYGHIAGDRVLRSVANQIRQTLREGDILMRYGGEEFLLVLPGASKDDAFKIAERIRYVVKESHIVYGENHIRVTVSIGCDSIPESEIENEQGLVFNSDKALYLAKGSGRNKVVIHGIM